jgi:predicted RNase H-like nuclease (RuvC/YqgF family)
MGDAGESMQVSDVIAIMAALISLGSMLLVWRKMPHETREMDARTDSTEADTADKFMTIANRAAERVIVLENRVKELETEVAQLKDYNRQCHLEREDLKDWAERLVHQIQSMGVEPVKLRKRKSEV